MATKIFPTVNDINGGVAGQGKTLTEANIISVAGAPYRGVNYVKSGVVLTNGGGLNLNVATGVYVINGYVVTKDATESVLLAASATNHVFLQLTVDGSNNVNGTTWVTNTTGAAPAGQPAVKVGKAVTDATTITTITATPRGINPVWTELPTNPVDGQEIRLQSAAMLTAGIAWNLRYDAASALAQKWEFIGGTPLYGFTTGGDQSTAGDAIFVDATGTPSLVAPAPGVYKVASSGRITLPGASVLFSANRHAAVDGAVPSGPQIGSIVGNSQYQGGHGAGDIDVVLAGGATVTMKVSTNNVVVSFAKARLELIPIRLGA